MFPHSSSAAGRWLRDIFLRGWHHCRRCLERIGKELRLEVTEEAAARALEAFDEDNSQTLDLEEFCEIELGTCQFVVGKFWLVFNCIGTDLCK